MAPRRESCDWTTDPGDKIVLVAFFASIKEKIGQGGSWDQTALEAAVAHMVARGLPKKGAPKNANSVKGVWAAIKRIHDTLVLVIQKRYPGASGWTYDQQLGFSVCDDNRQAWKEFVKHHAIFKPFANSGWEFFDDVKNILPTRARGMHVFNPAAPAAAPSQDSDAVTMPSQDSSISPTTASPASPGSNDGSQLYLPNYGYNFDFPDASDLYSQAQPLTQWSQTQFDSSLPAGGLPHLTQPTLSTPRLPALVPTAPAPVVPVTPSPVVRPTPSGASSGVKRAASDEFQTPWSTKRGKTTGADALLAIGGSVDRVGDAIRECFMPQKSSAVSPTKQVERAHQMAIDDQEAGALTGRERATLSLIFSRDTKAADAYVAEKTSEGRSALAEILLERF